MVALLSENSLHGFEVYWAAVRSGLYITAVNQPLAGGGRLHHQRLRGHGRGHLGGYRGYEEALEGASAEPFADQPHGATMLYSSGTTGRPKGALAVYDVAVIGVPDPEMGESVKAFIEPAAGVEPGPELEQEIIAFVKSKIAGYKAPRSVQFVDDLPRTETGKLVKGELKKRYVKT